MSNVTYLHSSQIDIGPTPKIEPPKTDWMRVICWTVFVPVVIGWGFFGVVGFFTVITIIQSITN